METNGCLRIICMMNVHTLIPKIILTSIFKFFVFENHLLEQTYFSKIKFQIWNQANYSNTLIVSSILPLYPIY